MLVNYLLSVGLVMVLLAGWCAIQQLARSYAKRHPELGPAREEGGGCGVSCHCRDETECSNENRYEM